MKGDILLSEIRFPIFQISGECTIPQSKLCLAKTTCSEMVGSRLMFKIERLGGARPVSGAVPPSIQFSPARDKLH